LRLHCPNHLLQEPAGLQQVLSDFQADAPSSSSSSQQPPAPTRAAALGFLARAAARQGALAAAVQMHRRALLLDPAASRVALSLAHTLEALNQRDSVLAVVLDHCRANGSVQLGPVHLQVRWARQVRERQRQPHKPSLCVPLSLCPTGCAGPD
jgi:Tfp pilus assembly protein PilF